MVKFKRVRKLSPNQIKKGPMYGKKTFAAMVFEEEPPTDEPALVKKSLFVSHF